MLLLIIGVMLPVFLSSCASVIAKYKFKYPDHELYLLDDGKLKTIPASIMEVEGYKKWIIDQNGNIYIVTRRSKHKEHKERLFILILRSNSMKTTYPREYKGMPHTGPSIFLIEIRRKHGQLTYSNMTLSKLRETLEVPKKVEPLLRISPESNIKLNDLYPLLTMLNGIGYKIAFVQIYRKDGKEIKSKRFLIDFEDWNEEMEGTSFLEGEKDIRGFFKDLK